MLCALAASTVASACSSPHAPSLPGPGGDADDDAVTDETTPPADDATDCTGTAGIDRGAVADFPDGAWRLVGTTRTTKIIVGHDAAGLFAFSAVCTHSGCAVNKPDTSGVSLCPCHLSRFDGNGSVLRGPATTPLRHYALTVCGDRVFVDMSATVAASTRTALP